MAKCKLCTKKATYGEPSGKAIYCFSHAKESGDHYVDVCHKLCLEPNCKTRPWVHRPGNKKTDYCRIHCVDGTCEETINKIITKLENKFEPTRFEYCRNVECGTVEKLKRATYGFEPLKPLYCKAHYDPTIHKDVIHPQCLTEGCTTRAGFAKDGKSAKYCGPCGKKIGFTESVQKKCAAEKCKTAPSYGIKGRPPTHCAKHADKDTMNNLIVARCTYENCNTSASYGYEKDRKLVRCAKHVDKSKMVIIKHQRCKFIGCTVTPVFGLVGGSATHCRKHKDENMVNLHGRRCEDCDKQPTFGIIGQRATHCVTHRDKATMVDVRHALCRFKGCTSRPTFGITKNEPIYCAKHAVNQNMIDVLNPRCEECNITNVNRNFKPYCSSCFYKLNPDAQHTINFKTKELAFTQMLASTYPSMILDKPIEGGRSRYRPDALLDVTTHCIIVEIDENQHSSYDNSVEDYRLHTLRNELGNRPLVVIRVNPDSFKPKDGNRVRGCFQRKPKTNTIVRLDKEFKRRLAILMSTFETTIASVPCNDINVISLFFDEID